MCQHEDGSVQYGCECWSHTGRQQTSSYGYVSVRLCKLVRPWERKVFSDKRSPDCVHT